MAMENAHAASSRRHKQVRVDKAVKDALAAQGGMIYPGQTLNIQPFLVEPIKRKRINA